MSAPHDAVLLIGFGGPEGPQDVLPFLRRVTAGKNIPDERLVEVGRHYDHFGGVSPINAFHRDLITRWAPLLAERWPGLPLYWGNRNAAPFIEDALVRMRDDGVRSAVAVATSAFSSFSSCRQYRQDIEAAAALVPGAPVVVKAHPFFDHPLMVDMWADAVAGCLRALPGPVLVLFSTHSLPEAAARAAGPGGTGAYVTQHRELAAAVVAGVAERVDQRPWSIDSRVDDAGTLTDRHVRGTLEWDLCFQSRSGPPHQPWLEPDVSDRLALAAEQGFASVVLVPLGFLSDHVEVLWDLDVVACADGETLGLTVVRAPTVGTDDRFPRVLTDLVAQYRDGEAFPSFRSGGPLPACPVDCCLPVARASVRGISGRMVP